MFPDQVWPVPQRRVLSPDKVVYPVAQVKLQDSPRTLLEQLAGLAPAGLSRAGHAVALVQVNGWPDQTPSWHVRDAYKLGVKPALHENVQVPP